MNALPPVLSILAGLVLLFSGRRVFWLAAALAAFLFTYRLLVNVLGPGWISGLVAAVVGLVFVWLAISFIRVVGVIVGALAGAVGLPIVLGLFGIQASWWVLALVGAIIGVIVVSLAFDWGLILMTAWMGANVIANDARSILPARPGVAGIALIVLLAAGILVQAGQLGRRR
jgi:hypothetical protein